jgi:PleD family two-component response regulator
MTPPFDRRNGPDRRRQPRGGRRDGDREGHSPLILVADDDPDSASRCEAILARLKFAVAPATNVDEALRVMRALRPELVVLNLRDAERLQYEMRKDPLTADIPVVGTNSGTSDPEALLEEIRQAIRTRRP